MKFFKPKLLKLRSGNKKKIYSHTKYKCSGWDDNEYVVFTIKINEHYKDVIRAKILSSNGNSFTYKIGRIVDISDCYFGEKVK